MVACEYQGEFRIVAFDDVQCLENRIRRTLVPGLVIQPLLSGDNIEKLAALGVECIPTLQQVLDQGMRLVLGQYADMVDSGIYAVRKGKIYNAEFAAKWNGRFCSPVC